MFGKKKTPKLEEIPEVEEEYDEEDEEDSEYELDEEDDEEEEQEEKPRTKLISKSLQKEKPKEGFTPQEVLDAAEGHLQRALNLIQLLK